MIDRFDKVYNAIRKEFPESGPVNLFVGLTAATGEGVIIFQESEDILETDNTRQTRSIRVRIVAVAKEMPDAKSYMNRAQRALEADPMIRIFSRTGINTEVEDDLPTPEGMCIASQGVDLR